MADNFAVVVEGDRQISLRFDQFPQLLHDKLFVRISALTTALAERIRSSIHDRTGKLRNAVDARVFDNKGESIVGYVSIDGQYAKAAALEYGAHGTAQVKAHSAKLDHLWSKRLNAPLTVMVSAHDRHMNITAQRFLRGPAAAMTGEIQAGLLQVVEQAAADGSQ